MVWRTRDLHQKFFSNRKLSFLVFTAGCEDNKNGTILVFHSHHHHHLNWADINHPKVQNFKHFFTHSDNQIACGCILSTNEWKITWYISFLRLAIFLWLLLSILGEESSLISGNHQQSLERWPSRWGRRTISEQRKQANFLLTVVKN